MSARGRTWTVWTRRAIWRTCYGFGITWCSHTTLATPDDPGRTREDSAKVDVLHREALSQGPSGTSCVALRYHMHPRDAHILTCLRDGNTKQITPDPRIRARLADSGDKD
jgi:hypothetical protein